MKQSFEIRCGAGTCTVMTGFIMTLFAGVLTWIVRIYMLLCEIVPGMLADYSKSN